LLSLLKDRTLRRFYSAHLQSQLGTGAAYVALLLVAYQRVHSAWAIAAVLLAELVPGVVLSPVCGALADRLERRKLAVGADLLRASAFIGLALVQPFVAVVALALLAGVGTAVFRPALNASLPSLTTEDQRSTATALYGAISNLGITAGPVLTAGLILFTGPTVVLGINGVTFLVSAALLARVPLGSAPRESEPRESVWADTRAGVHAATAVPGVTLVLGVTGMSTIAGGMINVAEPQLATHSLHAGGSGYALLVAIYGLGMIAGAPIVARSGSRIDRLRRRWLLGIGLFGTALLGTAMAPNVATAGVTFALSGLANTLIVGPEMRLLQELVTDRLRGRLFGLHDQTYNVAFILAFLGASGVIALVGIRGVFAVGGAASLVVGAVASLRFRLLQTPEPEPAMVTAAAAALP
jgi:MFS family permease